MACGTSDNTCSEWLVYNILFCNDTTIHLLGCQESVEWNGGMTLLSQMFNKYHPPLSKYNCYTMGQLHVSDLFHPIVS